MHSQVLSSYSSSDSPNFCALPLHIWSNIDVSDANGLGAPDANVVVSGVKRDGPRLQTFFL